MGRWGEELPSLGELSIPRWHKPSKFGRISNAQLHYFLDASTQEYRQCSYLRLINDKVNIHCSFVINKARVAILKSIKVPRLEFTAAVTSCKTSAQLQRELEYERVEEVFLTDSKVVFGSISNDTRRFHIFLSNWVQQIREQSFPDKWHYVETKWNLADYASRGLKTQGIQKTSCITGTVFRWRKERTDGDSERTEAQIKEQLPNNNCQCITSEMNVPSAIHIWDIWEHQIRSIRCLFFSNIGKKRCRHLNLHIPGKSH